MIEPPSPRPTGPCEQSLRVEVVSIQEQGSGSAALAGQGSSSAALAVLDVSGDHLAEGAAEANLSGGVEDGSKSCGAANGTQLLSLPGGCAAEMTIEAEVRVLLAEVRARAAVLSHKLATALAYWLAAALFHRLG